MNTLASEGDSVAGFPLSGKSLNVLECPGNEKMSWNRAKCPGKSWKLMHFQEICLFGIWNDDCCSISFKFEIPSTFLGKISWKLTKIKNVLECPGN